MRTFLALELPEDIKNEVFRKIEQYHEVAPTGIKWVPQENLHITLQFIGDTKKEDLPEITEYLDRSFSDLPKMKFIQPKLEIIPGRNPRVIWISFSTESKQIFGFSKSFKKKLVEMGYQLDSKPLRFHVTLGRIKKRLPEILINQILTTELKFKSFIVDEATLYQSFLRPQGPIYEDIMNYKFSKE
ncbi:MAG: RNA 2',3'-cyclic phosphodiesterase [Candidatus Cloacimonetes bacterium]|nr:RNA 2',3'-cyclic phosphodiesterase [Candidatus Cloacimonadota bacterium]MBL7148876.1 RNA 2',3'-cyclic phosphodiesterase [Candidatus Cloacimonadota bacterium]